KDDFSSSIGANGNDMIAFTATLNKMIAKRFDRLPTAAQQLLEVVVVAGQPIYRVVAKQVAGLAAEEQNAISYLRARHLIRVIEINEQAELETYHDRVREAIIEHLCEEKLKQLHLRLGLALENIDGIEPERLAVHFY